MEEDNWRRDKTTLEIFAFSLVLFLELNVEDSRASDLEVYKKVVERLIVVLEEVDSDRAEWLKSWFEGSWTLVVNPRYFGGKGGVFSTE